MERVASSGKAKEREVEEEEEEEQKKMMMVERVQREDRKLLYARIKEEKKGKEGRKRNGRPRARQVLGKSGRWLFLLPASGAELALCQRCSRRIAEQAGDDGKVAAAGS